MDEVIAKTVSHVHSFWSYDGKWELAKIANYFCSCGYDVVLTSEHDRTFDETRWNEYKRACRAASSDNILIVPGIEYSDEDNITHILVWGISEFLGSNCPTKTILEKVASKNGVCVLAHPSRHKAWQKIDDAWLPLFHGIELWNRKFDGFAPSREAVNLLNRSNKAIPFVGLDFHRANQAFPLSMMIKVCGALSEEAICDSIREARCRSLAFGCPAIYFSRGLPFIVAKLADTIRRVRSKIIEHT